MSKVGKMRLTIEDLSSQTQVKPSTIRFYERRGVLPVPQQSELGSRQYAAVDVSRVKFVRYSRGLGLDLDEIRALVEMIGEGNSEELEIAEQSILVRVGRLSDFCSNLRKAATAIRNGEMDEASALRLPVSSQDAANMQDEKTAVEGGSPGLRTQTTKSKGRVQVTTR